MLKNKLQQSRLDAQAPIFGDDSEQQVTINQPTEEIIQKVDSSWIIVKKILISTLIIISVIDLSIFLPNINVFGKLPISDYFSKGMQCQK